MGKIMERYRGVVWIVKWKEEKLKSQHFGEKFMKKEKQIVALLLVFMQFYLVSCIEPFNPPEIEQLDSYLVVEGFFNTANSESTIRLSRTINMAKRDTVVSERNASVVVERERGGQYVFTEKEDGVYTYPPEFIGQQENYRLRITAQGGKVYLSDFTTAKIAPPIDSIGYEVVQNGEGVQLNINTQDLSGNTRFYRWELEETWEYTAALLSRYVVNGKDVVPRTKEIYTCWKTNRQRRIVVGSTVKLGQDVLRNAGIATLPVSTNRFLIKYSALVKQYAITQQAYQYWTALAKTTENTGSIFDALPTLVTGNLHCETDPKEPVFGFFSAGAVSEKRAFIEPRLGMYPICYPKQFKVELDDLINSGYEVIGIDSGRYIVADKECVDCRLQGGTTEKPGFWNN